MDAHHTLALAHRVSLAGASGVLGGSTVSSCVFLSSVPLGRRSVRSAGQSWVIRTQITIKDVLSSK